ncbi:MAG: hypothetical protein HC901_02590 [Bdellovibrionaceae bacterium]|nr:hypothetical protein [Pseudobdellovibrionaceae bacterium]
MQEGKGFGHLANWKAALRAWVETAEEHEAKKQQSPHARRAPTRSKPQRPANYSPPLTAEQEASMEVSGALEGLHRPADAAWQGGRI